MKKYFISIVEEFWDGQKPNTFIGRAEVHIDSEQYAIDEIDIRSFNPAGVEEIRKEYDFKHIDEKGLEKLKEDIKKVNIKDNK